MEATGESVQSPPPSLHGKAWLPLCALILASLAVGLALIQQFYGLRLYREVDVSLSRITKDGKIYRFRLPDPYRTRLPDHRAILMENGRPLRNRAHHASDVARYGESWYHVHDGHVRFIPSDGRDPRVTHRKYSVRVPYQFKERIWWYLGAFWVLTFLWWSRSTPHRTRVSFQLLPPPWQAWLARYGLLAFFLLALLLTMNRVIWGHPYTDGVMSLKGIPSSDAGGWHTMAMGIAEGRGLTTPFASERPLYSVFLSIAYFLAGPKLAAARFINVLLQSAALTGIVCIGIRLRHVWLGLACALTILLSIDHSGLPNTLMTENAGFCIAVASLLVFWIGVEKPSVGWCLLAGVTGGIGHLASGMTLLTAPLYALLALAVPLVRRNTFRRSVLVTAAYTAGLSIVILPWMIRQKVVYDRFSISMNSVELLFGGSDPVDGKLSMEDFRQADEAGVNDNRTKRFDYFSNRFAETVRSDPGAYVQRVAHATLASFKSIEMDDPAMRMVGLLVLFGAGLALSLRRRGVLLPLATLLLIYLWTRLTNDHTLLLFAAGLALVLWRARSTTERIGLILLATTTLAVAMLNGLAGDVAPRRFWLVGDWTVFLILYLAMLRTLECIDAGIGLLANRLRLPRWLGEPEGAAPSEAPAFAVERPVARIACSIVAFTLLCCVIAGAVSLRGPKPFFPGSEALDLNAVREAVIARHPDARLHPYSSQFTPMLGKWSDQVIEMNAREDFGNWMPSFFARAYKRWIMVFTLRDPNASFPEEITVLSKTDPRATPSHEPVVWIALRRMIKNRLEGSLEPVFEVVAIAATKRRPDGSLEVDYERTLWTNPTPETIAALGKIKKTMPEQAPAK